ncbi:MAG: multidrug effflux MFS transporter [Nitratireductor sp.]|nr:multidrug effflux MFS transporter [Nitratireductor sp.]
MDQLHHLPLPAAPEILKGELAPRQRSRFLNRRTPPHILTLVLVAGLGALNMNIMLPSLTAMAHYFKTDYATMQLAISAYLACTAILQLIVGPLSDRFGRRPVLLVCLAIFLAATLAAIYSPTVEIFLAARMVQATVVSGLVLARAIVRDMVPLEEAASMIGYVSMGMSLVPMVSPTVGGLLQEAYGWQAVHGMTLAMGSIVLLIIFFDLQETNLHRAASMASQFRSYPELFTSRRFWGFVLSATFASGMFFAFLGGAPFIATEYLHLAPSTLGLYFMFVALGYMSGNFVIGRYSGRFGIFTLMLAGCTLAVSGVFASLLWFVSGHVHAFGFFGPLFFVGMGNGMLLPSALAGMVNVRPHLAGSAAGLGGAMQIGGGAVLSVFAGHLLTRESGPAPLLLLMIATGLLAILATLYTRHVDIQMAKPASKS